MEEQIELLQQYLNESNYTVAVTGAGISVPCGIKGFDGMNFPAVLQMMSVTALRNTPNHYYKMVRKTFLDGMFESGPSMTHKKLAALEAHGLLQGIITTNIDNLHSIAGSENVAEIQGSFAVNKCLDCGRHYDDVSIWNEGKAPRCLDCGGPIAAHPVYNHIGLLDSEVCKARRWISQAELVLIIGTNGPYGSVYYDYIRPQAKIVQINPKPTQFDQVSVLNIREKADALLK